MAWVKLDDQFPSHPKMVLAGGDAAWLHVCALCYCGQHLTDGVFPKVIVPRLSDRKKPEALAARLVEVGAWVDRGDVYEIHGYLEFNPSRDQVLGEREKRSAAGKRGAARRWQTDSTGHSDSHSNSYGTPHDDRTPDRIDNVDAPVPSPEEPKGSSTKPERDALFDALVGVFGTATTRARKAHFGKCVTELLTVGATPDEVRRRGENLSARGWDNPSPEALLKWWDTLDASPKAEAKGQGVPLSRRPGRSGGEEVFFPGTGWVGAS